MKKIVTMIIICILSLSLNGCGKSVNKTDTITKPIENNDTMYKLSDNGDYAILVDKETHVMYLFIREPYKGGLTVLLNSDGTPKLYNKQ